MNEQKNKARAEAKQVDIYNAVYGMIKAVDPCTFDQCMAECALQVVGFETLTEFDATVKVDAALNKLLREQNICISSSADEGAFDIGFRLEDARPEPKQMPNLGITVKQFFEVLKGFVTAGNCLIDDEYGVHKIKRVTIGKNSNGKDAGFVFQSNR